MLPPVMKEVPGVIGVRRHFSHLLQRPGSARMGCHVHVPQTAAVVLAVAERIRSDIEATARGAVRDADVMPITASFGLASLSGGARSLEALIDEADQALYSARQAGRNRVMLFESAAISLEPQVRSTDA